MTVSSLKPLRPLQQAALDRLKSSVSAGKRRIVLQLPTGAGKTVIAAHMASGGLAKGNRAAFVVPMISLIDQTFERFVENGISPGDMGVMQASHPWRRPQAPLQICSVQTIDRRGFPEAKFVMVDEAHVRFAAIDRWISERPDVLFCGLSATPWAKGMGEVWDDLIVPTTLEELISLGWLSKFRVFAAAKPDLSAVKTVAGEYHEGQLSEVMSGKQIVADVVSTWLEEGGGRPTLLFAVNRAHAATLHEQFNDAGVPCAYVDGETPRQDRREILGRYAKGEFKIISSVGTMTTGVDVTCRCVIDAAPTKSEIRHVQKIGRGLRAEDGKSDCVILDHAGNSLRLGLPTEIGRTTLRTGKTDEEEAKERDKKPPGLSKECSACGCLNPPRSKVCASCGQPIKRPSGVETLDGELVEVGAAGRAKGKSEPVLDQLRRQGKQAIYSQLCTAQGTKSDGWKSHQFRKIFWEWPRGLVSTRAPVSAALSSWLRAERIRWAKSQAKIRQASASSKDDGKALAGVA